MHYLIKGEFVEENIAGKTQAEVFGFIESVVHPSLEMLEKAIQEKKITGGIVAGERVGYFIIDVPSNEEVGNWLRGLPFWGALRWTVTPLQSPRSAVDQDKASRRVQEPWPRVTEQATVGHLPVRHWTGIPQRARHSPPIRLRHRRPFLGSYLPARTNETNNCSATRYTVKIS